MGEPNDAPKIAAGEGIRDVPRIASSIPFAEEVNHSQSRVKDAKGPLAYASRRTDPHLSGQTRETVFAAITLATGVVFVGVGALFSFWLLAYLSEVRRSGVALSILLLAFFIVVASSLLVAGWAVVRASWRLIARRGESYELPSLVLRNYDEDSAVGCVVGLLAVLMLLAAVGIGLIAIGLTVLALASGETQGVAAGLTFIVGCAAAIFVSVLLLRLKV